MVVLKNRLNCPQQGSTGANMVLMLGPLPSTYIYWKLPTLRVSPHYDPICGSPLLSLRINIFLCVGKSALFSKYVNR